MKKLFTIILIAFLSVLSFIAPIKTVNAANLDDNSVIILSGNIENNKIVIKANLTLNTGIAAMNLELSYDKSVMQLSNFEFGNALASLEPITTNTNTSEGYAITPFKINYLGRENDFTTGNLFTLTFDISSNINDGKYSISLLYEQNKDVNYYDEFNDVKTKNLFIDKAEIEFKNNSVSDITIVNSNSNETPRESNNKTLIIALCIAIPTVLLTGVLIVVFFVPKKKRNWKKYE